MVILPLEHVELLLRYAIGRSEESLDLSAITGREWRSVMNISSDQGVSAIAVDGLQTYYESNPDVELEIDKEFLEDLRYEWFANTFTNEEEYSRHKNVIRELSSLFSERGIKMMIVKGYASSLMYPIPSHRSMGDIDVYLFGRGEEADRIIKEKGIDVRQNEDKHSNFTYKGVSVENHATFVNVVEHPSLLELEHLLEQEAEVAVYDNTVGAYLPTPMADALFLSYHLAGHFVYGGASLKQVMDWVMLTTKYGKETNWNRVLDIADRAGYGKFLRCLDGIVVTHFGVMVSTFPEWERNLELEERILGEILHPEIEKRGESLAGKVFRYFRSRWKYRIVYKEPMLMTFFRRSWAYIREKYLPKSRSVWDR